MKCEDSGIPLVEKKNEIGERLEQLGSKQERMVGGSVRQRERKNNGSEENRLNKHSAFHFQALGVRIMKMLLKERRTDRQDRWGGERTGRREDRDCKW